MLGSYGTRIKTDMDVGFLAVNLISIYENLCALDVHGLADRVLHVPLRCRQVNRIVY